MDESNKEKKLEGRKIPRKFNFLIRRANYLLDKAEKFETKNITFMYSLEEVSALIYFLDFWIEFVTNNWLKEEEIKFFINQLILIKLRYQELKLCQDGLNLLKM